MNTGWGMSGAEREAIQTAMPAPWSEATGPLLSAATRKPGTISDRKQRAVPPAVPAPSRSLVHWFTGYSRWYIRRSFHSLRVSCSGLPPKTHLPLVVYSNHASWWDPLVFLVLRQEFFPERTAFAPMEASALEQYKFLRKLGFFAVEPGTRRGAVRFLRAGEAILGNPNALLALTPQSRFADPRERPVRFRSGLGHLALRLPHALALPMAAEYVFWEERLPEILVHFGAPSELRREESLKLGPEALTARFERELGAAQDALANAAKRREPGDFITLLHGGAGQGGIYDAWRWVKARLRGEAFRREHGCK